MTARQRALHDRVMAFRPELLRLAQSHSIDRTLLARLPDGFALRFLVGLSTPRQTQVMLTYLPEGILYREYDPVFFSRKGREPPRWRLLQRVYTPVSTRGVVSDG